MHHRLFLLRSILRGTVCAIPAPSHFLSLLLPEAFSAPRTGPVFTQWCGLIPTIPLVLLTSPPGADLASTSLHFRRRRLGKGGGTGGNENVYSL